MNLLIENLQKISPLSDETIQALHQKVQLKKYKRNTDLLKVGDVSRNIYFVNKGLARVYYYFNEIDVTDYFAIDGQFIGGIESLFTQQPSKKAIQLIEDSDVSWVKYSDLEILFSQYHDLERAGRKLAIFAFLEGQQRIESIRFHEAKERYLELHRKYPGLLNRCPLKYIASYLGITAVSLSRIRAEI